jgi:uncharacterized protein (DUF1778 family)
MPAKTPEQARAYDAARRRTERLKLRLTEDEAQRLRNAAAGAGMSLHTYMLAVADGRARPVVDLAHVAEFSTPIAALLAAPQAVRDLEADLGRLSERLAHLFTTDYALPSEHRAEIQATLSEVRDRPTRDTAGDRGVAGGDGGAVRGDHACISCRQACLERDLRLGILGHGRQARN